MDDYEFIITKCKNAHYFSWEESDIEECKERMQNLTHQELFNLRICRWMSKLNPLYTTLFELLYKDQLEKIAEKLNAATTEELLALTKQRPSNYQKQKIGEILFSRYESMNEDDKKKVYRFLCSNGFINNKPDSETSNQ